MNKTVAVHRNKWQKNFPNVILNSALGDASKHVQYLAAKTGKLDAAVSMVMDLINPETIAKITSIVADKQPLLIPVHAEEAVSINRIPLAYAIILAKECSLPVELNIG